MRFAKEVNGHPGPDPAEFDQLTPDTQHMARWVDSYCVTEFCQEMELTSLVRPGEESSHGDGRAFDVRTRTITKLQVAQLVFAIRRTFGWSFVDPRGTGKRLHRAWYHDSGHGWHLHCASPT